MATERLGLVRAMGTLLLFGFGVGAGVLAFGRLSGDVDYGPYPPKAEAAEPEAADRLTDLLEAGDDAAIAELLDEELLNQLSAALRLGGANGDPLVSVSTVRYLGTVAEGTDAVATYVVAGKFGDGTDGLLGFAIRVRGGEVVGVN